MANAAANFQQFIKHAWSMDRDLNAAQHARDLHATRTRDFASHEFNETPGDVPFGLWRFRDGSEIVISNDGSRIHATKGRGARAYEER